MSRQAALLAGIVLVAAGVVAYFQFLDPGGSNRPGEPGSNVSKRGSSTGGAEEGASSPGEQPGGTSLSPGVLAALKAMGIGLPAVGEGRALVVGRVVAKGESNEFEPVPGTKIDRFLMGEDEVPDTVVEETVATTADGWFLITVDSDMGYRFVASAPGMGSVGASVTRESLADGSEDLGQLVMAASAKLTVKVKSGLETIREELAPVAAMDLTIIGEGDKELSRAKTSKDGEAVFVDLPPGEAVIRGEMKPYAKVEKKITLTGGNQEVEINIQIVGQLKVRVKAPSGAILKSFRMCLDMQHGTYNYVAPRFQDVEGDDDGWVIMDDVKAHQHTLYATAKGYAMAQEEGIIVKPGEVTEITMSLPPGFSIRGKVVTRKGKKAVADAVVYSELDLIPSTVDTNGKKEFREIARATRTRLNGSFLLEDLSEGSHKIVAIHPDYAEGMDLSVTVNSASHTNEVVIELGLGSVLKGHCYAQNGTPDEGARVMVINIIDANMMKKAPLMDTCDKDGAYRIEHVPEGMRAVLRQSTRTRGNPDFKQQTFSDGVDVTMNFGEPGKGAVLKGTVTFKDGKPVKNRIVVLMSQDMAEGMPDFYQGIIDPDGKYELRGIKAGEYFIQLGLAGRGSDFAGREPITMPGKGVVHKDIVASGGDISGFVLSHDTGKPLTSGSVSVLSSTAADAEFIGRATLMPDGSFLVPNVPEGTYVLMYAAEHHGADAREGVVVQSGRVTKVKTVKLKGGGRIVGRVLDSEGNPLSRVQLFLRDPETQEMLPAWTWGTDSTGRFEVPYVPAGRYGVTGTKAGMTFPIIPVEVTVGGAPEVVLQAQ
jgi:hypothetical protein